VPWAIEALFKKSFGHINIGKKDVAEKKTAFCSFQSDQGVMAEEKLQALNYSGW
jgi:hypothetical protein